jgi:hypothetical protein
MLKIIFTIALVAGGIYAFHAIEQANLENPEILHHLDRAWDELRNGTSFASPQNNGSGTVVNGGGYSCSTPDRPNPMNWSAKGGSRAEIGRKKPAPPRFGTVRRMLEKKPETLIAAYNQWRDAIRAHNKIMAASRNGGQGPAVEAARQKVWNARYHYDTLKKKGFGN